MKKIISMLLVALLVMGLIVGCGGNQAAKEPEKKEDTEKPASKGPVFVNIGTGGTAGTYFPLGGALADIWNNNIEGVNATAQSTGASIANINLLTEGKVEVVFIQNDIAYYAEQGIELFQDKKVDNLRGLATLYPETIHIVTLNKNIKSIQDLKGKRVSVGNIGSVVEANARQIFDAAGVDMKDMKVQYLTFAEASNNLKDGNVDAAFVTAGVPAAAISDVSAQHNVTIIPLEDEVIEKLIEKYPYYTKIVVPKDTYRGQTEESQTVSVMSMLAVSSELDEDTAYNLMKTMYDNLDRIKAAHSIGAKIKPETGLEGMSIKLHSGAEKYFKENNLLK